MLADRLFASFDHLYVINLPARTDRRDEMAGELRRIGTGFDDPRVTLFAAVAPDEASGFRSIGARGCFLSHLGVLRMALQAGHKRILLLEDDCDFVARIDALLPVALDACDAGKFGIFYGGHHMAAPPIEAPVTRADPQDVVGLTHMMGFDQSTIARAIPYLELMLTRPAGSPDGGPMDVDGAYGWFRAAHPEIATGLAVPQLGVQRPSPTDISPPGMLDRLPLPRPARALLRGARRAWRRRI
ncbi:glycosyltransferase family 25 protein [Sphingomonas crocodyli]|uniref:LPS biosynthesis glycosyltransferase n=1 Tax=Sphingomonas crocodyli TaxID=1979270 RepID=A0A437LWU8_9SPHN|nr:glycosyltransferase family 25 protein [Sphingomonas crocodyli]RVT89807.1 LPS biosynthesis glycosyltransferase [Sphingomonas crocodyli]